MTPSDRAQNLRRLAEAERKVARRPGVIELCDAVLAITLTAEKPKTDRKAYMREFMRKKRAADKDRRHADDRKNGA